MKVLKILICTQLFLLAGCWDSSEIENLGIVLGIGLGFDEESNQYKLTHQYVVPRKIPGGKDGGGGGEGKQYQNITLRGDTFFEIIRENSLESSRPPNYAHLKSMLLSTQLVTEEPISDLVNFFLRDHEYRRTIPVFITKEPVETMLNLEPKKEMFPSLQISSLTRNFNKSIFILENLEIGDLSQNVSEKTSFVIPGIEQNEGRIRLAGAGIISAENHKYVGWLNSEEVGGLNWLKDDIHGGLVSLKKSQLSEGPVVLEIMDSNTKLTPKIDGEQISMDIKIKSSLRLGEDWNIKREVFNPGWKQKLTEAAEKEVKNSINNVLRVAQEEHGLDFVGFEQWVKIKQPKYWEKNKKQWNEIFKGLEVNLNFDFTIVGIGTQDMD